MAVRLFSFLIFVSTSAIQVGKGLRRKLLVIRTQTHVRHFGGVPEARLAGGPAGAEGERPHLVAEGGHAPHLPPQLDPGRDLREASAALGRPPKRASLRPRPLPQHPRGS